MKADSLNSRIGLFSHNKKQQANLSLAAFLQFNLPLSTNRLSAGPTPKLSAHGA